MELFILVLCLLTTRLMGLPFSSEAPLECEAMDEDPYIQFEIIEYGEDTNSTVSEGIVLKVSCTEGYSINLPNATVKCVHGNWKPVVPQCDSRGENQGVGLKRRKGKMLRPQIEEDIQIVSTMHEASLLNWLLERYQSLARPVVNSSHPTVVNISLTLFQVQLTENGQFDDYMLSNVWQTLVWYDVGMTWDPMEYGNITSLRIPPHRIWIPSIYAFNVVSQTFDTTQYTPATVDQTGKITLVRPANFFTSCKFGYNYFPLDEQKCDIKFGEWVYNGGELDLQLKDGDEAADKSSYIENTVWELIEFRGRRTANYYGCCSYPFVDVTFNIHVRRRGWWILLEAKASAILMLCTLFFSTLIPPSSGCKVALNIFHFLISMIPLWRLRSQFPNVFNSSDYESSTPMVLYFLLFGTFSLLTFAANILVVWLYHCRFSLPNKNCDNSRFEQVAAGNKSDNNYYEHWATLLDRCFFCLFNLAGICIWIMYFPKFI